MQRLPALGGDNHRSSAAPSAAAPGERNRPIARLAAGYSIRMNLARTAGATTAPALLTSCDDPDALDAFVRGLRLSIRQPAQVLVARRPQASGHPAPPPSFDGSFPVKLVETSHDCEPAAIWIELAERTLADKLIYLDPEYVASPSLVGAFEHALERVDALAHGPVCRLRRPFEALDERSLRAAGREARYENGAGSSPLEVATSPSHPGALNFAARRHTLERICAADPADGATPAEQLLAAGRGGFPRVRTVHAERKPGRS